MYTILVFCFFFALKQKEKKGFMQTRTTNYEVVKIEIQYVFFLSMSVSIPFFFLTIWKRSFPFNEKKSVMSC